MVGLVAEDLSDILSTPPNDSAVTKKRTKRITGARNLTFEEYVEMLREDKRKKIEVEEMQEMRKHEREKRKREIEEKKKETQLKKRQREEEKEQQNNDKLKAQANTRRQVRESSSVSDNIPDGHSTSSSSTGSDSVTLTGEEPRRNRPQCRSKLPAGFCEDIDDADGVLCEVSYSTGPEGLASGTVFWINCDKCGVWVHNYYFFQKNNVSRKYVCTDCSANSH